MTGCVWFIFVSVIPITWWNFCKCRKCDGFTELGGVGLSSGRGRATTMMWKAESMVGRLPWQRAGHTTTAWSGGRLEAGGASQHCPWEEASFLHHHQHICWGSWILHCVKWETAVWKIEENMVYWLLSIMSGRKNKQKQPRKFVQLVTHLKV